MEGVLVLVSIDLQLKWFSSLDPQINPTLKRPAQEQRLSWFQTRNLLVEVLKCWFFWVGLKLVVFCSHNDTGLLSPEGS